MKIMVVSVLLGFVSLQSLADSDYSICDVKGRNGAVATIIQTGAQWTPGDRNDTDTAVSIEANGRVQCSFTLRGIRYKDNDKGVDRSLKKLKAKAIKRLKRYKCPNGYVFKRARTRCVERWF